MDRGTMWLLVYIFSTTAAVQSELASPHGFLKGAVAGFDPFYMTSIVAPNPGKRSSLFQHLWGCYYDNQVVPNSFINNDEETNCLPEITVRSIVNYKDFKDFSSSSSYELASDANWGTSVGYDNFTSCEGESNALDRTMLQFFRDTSGEVVLATSSCVTHTISISPFEPVTFTQAFQRALATLYKAALNPMPEIRRSTFAKFIWFYGTHFSRRTRLGSRVIFGKLFSTRAATVEEDTARRRCVREAAYEALTPGARNSNETTRTVFTKASAQRCGGEEHKTIVSVTGTLPERSLEDWASSVKKSPQPIFHDLEPLSTLFNKDWFDIIHQSMQLEMNGSALYNFFVEHFSDYSSRMMCGGSNKSPSRGCTLDSNCTDGTECRSEPYTAPGYICVPKHDATTTTSTTSTTTTQATTTSTTSTTTPTPSTTTTLRPCPACLTCPTCSEGAATSATLIAVEGQTKTLTSHPGFGTSNYTDLAIFSRVLEAPSGLKVRIRFQSFQTESCCDYLYIHDGSSPSGTQLAKLSGSPTLSSNTSSGHRMFLLFATDHSAVGTGFSLLYEAVV